MLKGHISFDIYTTSVFYDPVQEGYIITSVQKHHIPILLKCCILHRKRIDSLAQAVAANFKRGTRKLKIAHHRELIGCILQEKRIDSRAQAVGEKFKRGPPTV